MSQGLADQIFATKVAQAPEVPALALSSTFHGEPLSTGPVLGKEFFNLLSKALFIKRKTDKTDLIKIKNFYAGKILGRG